MPAETEEVRVDSDGTAAREMPDIEAGNELNDQQEIQAALKLINDEPSPESTQGKPAVDAADPKPTAGSPTAGSEDPTKEIEVPPADESKSKSWAAISRAQAKIDTDRDALKSQRHEIEQLQAQIQTQQTADQSFQEKLKLDPFGTLQAAGLPFEVLAKQVIDGNTAPKGEVTQPKSEIAQLQEQVSQLTSMLTNQQSRTVLENYQGQLRGQLDRPEFKVLAAHPSAVDQMTKLAGRHAELYGETLPPEIAAARIQEEWVEELKSLQTHAAVQELLGLPASAAPADEPAPEELKPAPKSKKPPSRTLTNDLASASTPGEPLPADLSEAEEIRRAAALVPDNVWDNVGDF